MQPPDEPGAAFEGEETLIDIGVAIDAEQNQRILFRTYSQNLSERKLDFVTVPKITIQYVREY